MERARRWSESPRRLWWTSFACLAVVIGAWSMMLPVFAGPDESSHAMRATAVPRGQLIGQRLGNADQVVVRLRTPAGYADYPKLICYLDTTTKTPACMPPFRNSSHLVRSFSDEYRAFPAYYGFVGLPSLAWPGQFGFYFMRVLSALLCAAFLASSFVAARAFDGRGLMTAGVALAMTPQVLYLAGVLNANSLEIAASICLWTAALLLVRSPRAPTSRDVARVGIAATALILTRGLSPAFALIALAIAALVASRDRLRQLARRRDVRLWTCVVGVALVLAFAWIGYLQYRYPLHGGEVGAWRAIRGIPRFVRQSVGEPYGPVGPTLPTHNVWLPLGVYVIWVLGTVGIVVLALTRATNRSRLLLLATIVLAAALPLSVDAFQIPEIGVQWIGRYGLPLLVGIPLVAASAYIDKRERWLPVATRVVVGATFAIQIFVFYLAMRRYAVGTHGAWNPLTIIRHAQWTPPPGPAVVWFLLLVAGLSVLAYVNVATADDRQT